MKIMLNNTKENMTVLLHSNFRNYPSLAKFYIYLIELRSNTIKINPNIVIEIATLVEAKTGEKLVIKKMYN